MNTRIARRILLVVGICASFANIATATDYFVATNGSDVNNGTIGTPFATFTKAIATASAGDTIYARGGTYNLSSTLSISKTGTQANPFNLFAYQGENPVLNFSTQATGSASRGVSLSTSADWWHIKGLTIEHAGDNGFYSEGDFGVYEQLVTRYNRDSGFQLHNTASNNLVLNCDSYENYDAITHGENADGFAFKNELVGPGNIFRGNRAWGNADDGLDVYYTVNYGILVDDCWSFDNGINLWGDSNYQGDGNGFKLGNPGGPSVVINSLAVDNPHNGMDINGSTAAVKVFNSTSYSNSRNWRFDQPVAAQILKNNISYQGENSDSIVPAVSDSFNSWNGGVTLDDDDFQSLVRVVNGTDLLKAPRQADGSLPDLGGFLKLAENSDLINAGTPISFVLNGVTYTLPFNGSAPDLGAYEFVPSAPPVLLGDFNGDDVVDALDYTQWRNNFGDADETNINNSGDGGDVGEGDFDVWKLHYGDTASPGGGGIGAAIPEPGSVALVFLCGGMVGLFRLRFPRTK